METVTEHEEATMTDRVDLADALIRNNEWERADTVLDASRPPSKPSNATGSRP